jgi:L-aspartate oxidase
MNVQHFDVLIIGCGIAGLSCGLKLAEKKYKVGILTREEDPNICNTYWAQGGIIYNQENPSLLIEDILRASSFTSNLEAAKILAFDSVKIFDEILLEKAKTQLAKSGSSLSLTQEAAHSTKRIAYQGDFTGKEIQVSLLNFLKDKNRFPNVHFLTAHTAIDLITPDHHGVSLLQRYEPTQVVGAYALSQKTGEVQKIMAKKTILATGGVGSLYVHHTNSEGARGDGHAMANRVGAHLINMEFIQFHPTTFFNRTAGRRFLITEALRGEGGILLNSKGQRFLEGLHPDLEMAPRDVVARSIGQEMLSTKEDCVYLDISFKDADWLKNRFPTIYRHCLENRIDITQEPIPVVPAAHYTCGGVKTDLEGKTNIVGLYAIGEVACTGLHGANRLASTSLLEGLVFGYRCAEKIHDNLGKFQFYDELKIKDWSLAKGDCDLPLVDQDWTSLRQTMWNYVGLMRSDHRLRRAQAMINELSYEVHRFYRDSKLQDSLIGLRNALEISQVILFSSMRNKTSIGCFYRG